MTSDAKLDALYEELRKMFGEKETVAEKVSHSLLKFSVEDFCVLHIGGISLPWKSPKRYSKEQLGRSFTPLSP